MKVGKSSGYIWKTNRRGCGQVDCFPAEFIICVLFSRVVLEYSGPSLTVSRGQSAVLCPAKPWFPIFRKRCESFGKVLVSHGSRMQQMGCMGWQKYMVDQYRGHASVLMQNSTDCWQGCWVPWDLSIITLHCSQITVCSVPGAQSMHIIEQVANELPMSQKNSRIRIHRTGCAYARMEYIRRIKWWKVFMHQSTGCRVHDASPRGEKKS
jgi:hypothetical protein